MTEGNLFHTVATVEDLAYYFQNNKKLSKKLTIIQTACHTIFERKGGLFKRGFCLIVTDLGDTREIDVRTFFTPAFKIGRRSNDGLKSFFEMLYAVEKSIGK